MQATAKTYAAPLLQRHGKLEDLTHWGSSWGWGWSWGGGGHHGGGHNGHHNGDGCECKGDDCLSFS